MNKAFTLIELLIVIAIILILIAIALPNFLEAQVRAKVSNVAAEMRSIESAIASYFIDHNRYPADGTELGGFGFVAGSEGNPIVWSQLTTPVKYYTTIPVDEFLPADYAVDDAGAGAGERDPNNNVYRYYADGWRCAASGNTFTRATPFREAFCTVSPSSRGVISGYPFDPDKAFVGEWITLSAGPDQEHSFGEWAMHRDQAHGGQPRVYSATNGTRSYGDIVKWGS